MKKFIASALITLSFYGATAQPWLTTATGNHIYNNNTGNVGIRTTNPVQSFQVWDGGTNPYTGTSIIPGDNPQQNSVFNTMKSPGYGIIMRAQNQDNGKGQSGIVMHSGNGSTIKAQVALIGGELDFRTGINYTASIDDASPGASALFINYYGNVGIGTYTPGSYKLAVEGKIGAREVRVFLGNWADYVFSKDYKLMSLESLEAFIKKNSHLPNIPSAQEVKENGGIDLGEINTKLLEKIEELTLHLIELNKNVQQLKKENSEMKMLIKSQKTN